jgi:hypothetical protein
MDVADWRTNAFRPPTIGSPKASMRRTCRRRGRCWMIWHEQWPAGGRCFGFEISGPPWIPLGWRGRGECSRGDESVL